MKHHNSKKCRQEAYSSLQRDAMHVLETAEACLGSCGCCMQGIQFGGLV